MNSRDILRALFFCIFAIICLAQCYTIISSFLQRPLVIDLYNIAPKLISLLPGITICNNNRFSLRKLIKRNPVVGKAMEEMFPDHQRARLNTREFNSFRDELARIFTLLRYSPQLEMDNSTLNELFETKPETYPFIQWIDCVRTWTDSIDCPNLSQIDSIQDRKCTTLFHKGAIFHDFIHRPQLFDSATEAANHSYFDAKEVVKIVLNFEPEDYADLKRQIGARILFHSSKFVASSSNIDFFITRGYRYDFSIDRAETRLLSQPYGNCGEYDQNLDRYRVKLNPRIPLAGDGCYQSCIVRNIVARMRCWPPTMPYYRNDTLDPGQTLKPCSWSKDPQQNFSLYREMLRVEKLKERRRKHGNKTQPASSTNQPTGAGSSRNNSTASEESQNYMRIKRLCWSQCAISCTQTRYSVTMTRSVWPSQVQIIFDKSGLERGLRHCCALVTIKLSHLHYDIQEYVPKYNLVDTIGNVGGLLAVWLGLSIVSVYHAIQKLIEFCHHKWLQKLQARTGSLKQQNVDAFEHQDAAEFLEAVATQLRRPS